MDPIRPGSTETSFRDEPCPLGPEDEPHLARRSERLDFVTCSRCGFAGDHSELLARILTESATALASWGWCGLTGSPARRARMTAFARRFVRGGFDESTSALILAALAAYEGSPITPAEALALSRQGRALETPEPRKAAA